LKTIPKSNNISPKFNNRYKFYENKIQEHFRNNKNLRFSNNHIQNNFKANQQISH
jgi:hypothetical protein